MRKVNVVFTAWPAPGILTWRGFDSMTEMLRYLKNSPGILRVHKIYLGGE